MRCSSVSHLKLVNGQVGLRVHGPIMVNKSMIGQIDNRLSNADHYHVDCGSLAGWHTNYAKIPTTKIVLCLLMTRNLTRPVHIL